MHEVAQKRRLLATTKMRFSPEVQRLKEETTDRVIEQTLATLDAGRVVTAHEVQKSLEQWGGFHMELRDIESALERLEGKGKVICEQETDVKLAGGDLPRVTPKPAVRCECASNK